MIRVIRCLHYSYRTEEAYVGWARRFLSFARARELDELNAGAVQRFLEMLAVREKVAASTQNQALNGLVFFFREGLGKELGALGEFTQATRPRKIPVVLTRNEVDRLFSCLRGEHRLMARLLYGSGLRLMDCMRLRVKDLDFERGQIIVRDGKGAKDRVTMLPQALHPELKEQLEKVQRQHEQDLQSGHGEVYMPDGLSRKYPGAAKAWPWQYVFPSDRLSVDPRSGRVRRHHACETTLQRAVAVAVKQAGIAKRRHVIASATVSRRNCWKMVMTFGPCRNYWAMSTWRRRKSTRTSCKSRGWGSRVRWMDEAAWLWPG